MQVGALALESIAVSRVSVLIIMLHICRVREGLGTNCNKWGAGLGELINNLDTGCITG